MADPEGRKRARLPKSGRTIRVTKPTLLCQRVGHSEGFCPRKNPPKAGAGRVGEGSHRAALKTRNPPGGFRRAYHSDNYGNSITRRSKCQWLTLRPTKPFDHCGESRGCPRGCGTLRWREQNSAGRLSARAPSNERRGRRRDPALGPYRFKTRARGPFPDPVGNFPDTLI